MKLLDLILGRPLASSEDQQERVGPIAGVSVFGLDALSSAAYGPEAALTVLIPLGAVGIGFSLPITIAVQISGEDDEAAHIGGPDGDLAIRLGGGSR